MEQGIFDFWNKMGITVHRKLNDNIRKRIENALKYYSAEQIKESILHYAIVYKEENYFFKYKYKLDVFLMGCKRQTGIAPVEKFMNDGSNWVNYVTYKERENKKQIEPKVNKAFIKETDITTIDELNAEYETVINKLSRVKYSIYLQTEHWKEFSKKAISNAHFKCQLCNKDKVKLNVHHKTYENRGHETYDDVIVLCEDCHRLIHNIED